MQGQSGIVIDNLKIKETGENPWISLGFGLSVQKLINENEFSNAPTENSSNLITSGAVYTAIQSAFSNLPKYDGSVE
jgi:hypothetical protein